MSETVTNNSSVFRNTRVQFFNKWRVNKNECWMQMADLKLKNQGLQEATDCRNALLSNIFAFSCQLLQIRRDCKDDLSYAEVR